MSFPMDALEVGDFHRKFKEHYNTAFEAYDKYLHGDQNSWESERDACEAACVAFYVWIEVNQAQIDRIFELAATLMKESER